MVNPRLKQQLTRSSNTVPLQNWLRAVLRDLYNKFDVWRRVIAEQGWCDDERIREYMEAFCSATSEIDRYKPFIALANRILELGREKLGASYPVSDVAFAVNAHTDVVTDKEQDKVSARRRPDVVMTRSRSQTEHGQATSEGVDGKEGQPSGNDKDRVYWGLIMQCVELKKAQRLLDVYVATRAKAKLPSVSKDTTSVVEPVLDGLDVFSRSSRAESLASSIAEAGPSLPSRSSAAEGDLSRQSRPSKKRQRDMISDAIDSSRASNAKKAKLDREPPKPDANLIQLASYALEMMHASGGSRIHCIGHLLKDDRLTPSYYDACGAVHASESISMIYEFPKFAAFIIAMASLTPEQHGSLPSSAPTSPPSTGIWWPRESVPPFPYPNLSGCKITLYENEGSAKQTLRTEILGEHIFTQYTLLGRRTSVYGAELRRSGKVQKVVVKLSYQASDRPKEQSFVIKACRAKVEHVPQIKMSADLLKMSDGIREAFLDATGEVAPYVSRTLRVIVYPRYRPLKELFTDQCLFIPVMVAQLIDCLTMLKERALILHRDVSINNIMYEVKDGRYIFVLIDFDMATTLLPRKEHEGSLACTSRDCTGTLPFMARELVRDYLEGNPSQHRLRHEFESLLYVCIWSLCMFVHGELSSEEVQTLEAVMRAWENSNEDVMRLVVGQKGDLCTSGHKLRFSPAADPLDGWFCAWTELFTSSLLAEQAHDKAVRDCIRNRLPIPVFDRDTMNGTFTATKLKNALTPYMPIDDAGKPLDTFVDAALYGDLLPDSEACDDEDDEGGNDAVPDELQSQMDHVAADEVSTPPRSETAVASTDVDEGRASERAGPSTAAGSPTLTPAPSTTSKLPLAPLPAVSLPAPTTITPPPGSLYPIPIDEDQALGGAGPSNTKSSRACTPALPAASNAAPAPSSVVPSPASKSVPPPPTSPLASRASRRPARQRQPRASQPEQTYRKRLRPRTAVNYKV